MKNSVEYVIALLFLITGISCSNTEGHNDIIAFEAAKEINTSPQVESTTIVERKLIKTGEIRFETTDLDETRTIILKTIKKYNGYISSDREFQSGGRKSNTIVIRVPSQSFDTLLNEAIEGVKSLDVKEIDVQDVTEEFLDAQARLKTKKELELRYLELLKQAKNVKEMLEIEEQVGKLRSEIESIEGRLQYFKSQVAYSTLSITFYEHVPEESTVIIDFSSRFQEGWNNFIEFFLVLTSIWPFILILFGLIIGIKMYRKKKNTKESK